jgi:RNA polymerase sigma-70 factor (ECF subfamily)
MAMPQDSSFQNLMARLRTGDNQAATRVFHRFADRLITVARGRLDQQIRQKVDPEDILQSVFRSFFTRCAAGQITDLASWDNLWGMLVVITMRKCGRQIDYFHAACRDVQREVSVQPATDSNADWEAEAAEPTPLEAAMLAETVEQLMASLEPRQRQILSLSLQGLTVPEVSAQVGCTERTVYRALDRVKEWLEQLLPDEKDPALDAASAMRRRAIDR